LVHCLDLGLGLRRHCLGLGLGLEPHCLGFGLGLEPHCLGLGLGLVLVLAFTVLLPSLLSTESSLVRHISQNAVFHGRALSCLGQNVLFCMRRYNCSIRDLSESANNITKSFVFRLFDENMHCTANFLFELIMIKKQSFVYRSK